MIRARTRWTDEEEKSLTMQWGECSLAVMARRFKRSEEAVHLRATRLGLYKRECWTTLQGVADASGFDRERVLRILRWKKVTVRTRVGTGTKRTHIDRASALDAVEAWCQTETARMAADVRGKSYAWLKRRLVWSGVYVEAYGHRYASDLIDRAIAEYAHPKRGNRNQHARKT
jgi:hypothetical protein